MTEIKVESISVEVPKEGDPAVQDVIETRDKLTVVLEDFTQDTNDPTLYVFNTDATIRIRYNEATKQYSFVDDQAFINLAKLPQFASQIVRRASSAAADAIMGVVDPAAAIRAIAAAETEEFVEKFDKFEQQCLMMKQIATFKAKADQTGAKSFNNFLVLNANSTQEIFESNNIIHGSKYFNEFLNIPNHFISALVPRLRLYKSYMPSAKTGGKVIDLEIPMEEKIENITEAKILAGDMPKGFGFGLESFSWENTSFNEADRNISANLVLKFSSMDSFSKTRTGLKAGDWTGVVNEAELLQFRFLELIYQAPAKVNTKAEKIKDANLALRFKIKVAVGWDFENTVLENLAKNEFTININELKNSIRANNYMLYLYNKGHDINIDPQGRVTVTIQYQSALEATITDPNKSNILGPVQEAVIKALETIEKDIDDRKELLAKTREESPDAAATIEDLTKKIDALVQQKESVETTTTLKLYSDFLDGLFLSGRVRMVGVKVQDLIKLKRSVYPKPGEPIPTIPLDFDSVEVLDAAAAAQNKGREAANGITGAGAPAAGSDSSPTAAASAKIEELRNALLQKSTDRIIIPFFYFGDLLDYVIEKINKMSASQKDPLRVLVGPVVYKRLQSTSISGQQKAGTIPNGPKTIDININLAQVPISFSYFLSWFEQTVVQNRTRTMPFKHFLSAILSRFLAGVLSPNCFGRNFSTGPAKVDINLFSVTPKGGRNRLTGRTLTEDIKKLGGTVTVQDLRDLDQLELFSLPDNTRIIPYVYLQMFYSDSDYKYKIHESENNLQGIYWLKSSIDRGLVKQVSFSKDENRAMPVFIYSQQGTINPSVLRTPYNATVSMVGNTMFKPGHIVYVDPTFTLSAPSEKARMSSVIEEMGLGGYYIITATKNSISSGKFSTDLTLRFANYGTRPAVGDRG